MNGSNLDDGTLLHWDDVAEHEWSGILIGNGASIAVWDRFRYSSLFDAVSDGRTVPTFSAADLGLFSAMQTQNFETVLSALQTSEVVCQTLRMRTEAIRESYETIRQALIGAVNAVHVPWTSVRTDVFDKIRRELRRYKHVYSVNYDLLIYWAIMAGDPKEFLDYFWSQGNSFDVADTEIRNEKVDCTEVLYLHGAVHLFSV